MATHAAVALVLHGHLPYATPGSADDRLGERWLLEALWECYLPLEAMLARLGADGVPAALTLSISPPLGSMLRHPRLPARMAEHLAALGEVNAQAARRFAGEPALGAVAASYAERLRWTTERWLALGGDLLGALERHRRAGRLELLASSVTHAYLPGFAPEPDAMRTQLALGLRSFERLCGHRPLGLWLPECAYDAEVGRALASAAVGYTVIDAHGIERARPRPAEGTRRPVLGPGGVGYFGRDQTASHQVWSRARGYPGDPVYREFYRDLGYELGDGALAGLGAGLMTGLKYYRITGPGPHKEPYVTEPAAERSREHADHFVETCARRLGRAAQSIAAPLMVAAYDAELFGHWWFEGPSFLERVLRRLGAHPELRAVTLGQYLEAEPRCALCEPASSTWGEGGYADVWLGPRASSLWRHVHEMHRRIAAAVRTQRHATGARGLALDQAIRESLLLQASDWPFMLHGGELADFARSRVRTHFTRAERWLEIVHAATWNAEQQRALGELASNDGFLHELAGAELRDAYGD
jgi:1,4-alpha-glucan branching enzyme